MRHARQTLWQRLFELPDEPALPLQARLRAAVVREILGGRLAEGTALPSSRDLAQLLTLSRNTVTAAYQQLVDDGFLVARPRSGVFVAPGARQAGAYGPGAAADTAAPVTAPPAGGAPHPAADWQRRVRRSLAGRPTLTKPPHWQDVPYPFVYGRHDPQLFPLEDFRECCARSLARAQMQHWTPDFEIDEVPGLVEQIRLRVLPKRGVFALADEIVVTVGAQQAFHLLGEALLDPRTRLGLEEPGYPHARNAFALREPQLLPVPVDEDGLVVDALPPLDYVFVTPSQHSPTTVTLSLDRRQRLLARAEREDFVVIEDDYEAENLHEGAPIPALKSLDRSGRVVYVGSLAKSLAPAVRLGYIVAPAALAAELRRLRHVVVRHPSAFLQHAYALFLALGHHEAHARRASAVMQERTQRALAALALHLPQFRVAAPRGGASLWLRGPAWLDGGELARTAAARGVLVEPGDVFFLRPPYPCPHVRLRLSSIAPGRIEPGIAALAEAVRDLARARGIAPAGGQAPARG
jgi:GntR family transcriptional regulator/MocR family aminotransferase